MVKITTCSRDYHTYKDRDARVEGKIVLLESYRFIGNIQGFFGGWLGGLDAHRMKMVILKYVYKFFDAIPLKGGGYFLFS